MEEFKAGQIQIYLGDALSVMDELINSGVKVDTIICDVPFGTTKSKWDTVIPFDEMWSRLHELRRSTSTPILLFGAEPFSSKLRLSNEKHYKYDWVWDKVKSTGFLNSKKQPLRGHEFIHVFYEKQCYYNPQKTKGHILKKSIRKDKNQTTCYNDMKGNDYESDERYPRSILRFSSDTQKSAIHPNQKPVALLEYFLKTYTKEGDTVLDFTAGSMSLGEACLNTNRKCILIEKDENFYEDGKNRIVEHANIRGE